jgi:hypothetical protein
MPIAKIVARYSENEKDTITLLCGVDEENQIRQATVLTNKITE